MVFNPDPKLPVLSCVMDETCAFLCRDEGLNKNYNKHFTEIEQLITKYVPEELLFDKDVQKA